MKIIFGAFLIMAFISTTNACETESVSCSDSKTKKTTRVAVLKSNLIPMILTQPVEDAKKRVEIGDFRLLAVRNLTTVFPGIDTKTELGIICYLGGRFISGIGDSFESDIHAELMIEFIAYIEKYNSFIISHYKKEYTALIENDT